MKSYSKIALMFLIFIVFTFSACGGGGGGGGSGDPVSSSSKEITSFTFTSPAATGIITEAALSIAVTVPYGTDVTALAPSITHTGVSISPDSDEPNDFTSPQLYTVTAEDGSAQTYSVTVTEALSNEKMITSFTFPTSTETIINEAEHTIALTVPFGTDRSNLSPTITHTGASIYPGSGWAQNFTTPQTYTVTAADSSTQDYTVTVTVTLASAKAITGFTFPTSTSTVINQTAHTIAVTVPYLTNVTALVPTIIHTGASINPASGSAQNFTAPQTYTVTAADSSTQDYTVTVTVTLNSAKAITAFTFPTSTATTITEASHTINVTVPNATVVTALVPTITHTGASISPASGSAQNFSTPKTYTVTAANGTTQPYTVTVYKLPAVTTTPISNIAGISAKGGGTITSEGSSTVTHAGICWNTTGSPTTLDYTADVPPASVFIASMTFLNTITTYYYRAYARNSWGISYGDQYTFNSGYQLGTTWQGGYVFYNNGSGGGRVCATSDQSTGIIWTRAPFQGIAVPGINDHVGWGNGSGDTAAIVSQAGAGTTYAAGLCDAYTGGGYTDWYLPSRTELYYMWYMHAFYSLGGFAEEEYWSSSQYLDTHVWYYDFNSNSGVYDGTIKSSTFNVRAVRAF